MAGEVEQGVTLPLKGGDYVPPPQEGAKTMQYIATLVATIGAVVVGNVLSWTSPALPILQSNVTYVDYLDEPMTEEEGGWVGSLLAIGALIGAFPAGYLCEKIGRKWTIIGLGIPFAISWVMIVFATNVGTLYAARLITGVATGGSTVAIPMYIGEIAEASVRGALGSFFQLLLTVGIMFTYVLGTVVDYKTLAILSGIIPIILMVAFFFMPESPSYLMKKGDRKQAEQSLRRLRGPSYDVKPELNLMEDAIVAEQANKASFKDIFATRANVNGLIVGLGLMFFQQFSGINAVIFYTAGIFSAAGTSLDPNLCSIIVGVVQVVVTFIASQLVDRAGRRILLLISSTVMFTCLVILGVYFHMKDSDASSVANIGWLPLLAVNLFIVTFSLGFGPLPWMMMAEIFSPQIKSIAAGMAVTLNWTSTFIVTKLFPIMLLQMGSGPTFWLFGGITFFGILFVFFRVPETKGKSFAQIQRELGGS